MIEFEDMRSVASASGAPTQGEEGGQGPLETLQAPPEGEHRRDAFRQREVIARAGRPSDWDRFKSDFLRIEREAFENTPGGGWPAEEVSYVLLSRAAISAVLLDRAESHIIGYTFAWPEEPQIYAIVKTAIEPAAQGQGLVVPLLNQLEQQCVERNVRFLVRHAANYDADSQGRTYAMKIMAANGLAEDGGRIIEYGKDWSRWGPQVYMKMDLELDKKPMPMDVVKQLLDPDTDTP